MLVFIIPLKSPQIAKSWDLVCKLFERCIKSVCNQASPNFRVIVVCHEIPKIKFSHSHIHYIEVDFPIPGQDIKSRDADKAQKILAGFSYAKKFNPSHVMVVDADDCVSKRLADFVNQHPQSNGWFLTKGYIYQENSNLIFRRRKAFNTLSGTSLIIHYGLYEFVVNQSDYNHVNPALPSGMELESLPFIGSIYIIGNGENIFHNLEKIKQKKEELKKHSLLFQFKNIFHYRLLVPGIRNEFGLHKIS